MTEPISFTVVIPCYESAHLVGDAVSSVLAQTQPPAAIVVVDDGSTDGLTGALAPFGAAVQLLRIEHGGTSAALNRGLAEVRTPFVAFLDADDRYEPAFLEEIARLAAAQPELDVITVDVVFDTPNGPKGTFFEANEFPDRDQRLAILRSCFLTIMSGVRIERVRAVGGFDESLWWSKDWDLWMRIVLDGGRVGVVRQPLARYRLHDAQLSAKRAQSLAARVTMFEKVLASGRLSNEERTVALETLATTRARAVIVAAIEAGSRGRWLALARDGRLGRRARAFGVLGAVSPGLAARRARLRW